MSTTWPDSLFTAPILRGLDPAGRRAVENAGRLHKYEAGQRVFAVDELGDSFFVVDRGEVELRAHTRRGFDESVRLRVARAGETFGEESTLPGARRRADAITKTPVQLAEIPAALFQRALGRSGGDVREAPEQRLLRRRATADLLRQVSLAEALPETDFELLLDAAEHRELRRGERVYAAGDISDGLYLIAHGLVQLQTEEPDGGVIVRAYLSDGDFFGDTELLDGERRSLFAVATGESHLLLIPPKAFRSLVDRNPDVIPRLRRISASREARQAATVEASPHTTRHVFADLYRMQMARSLLTIDQDACVRCGHCAWSCEQVHGVARLVRRGDKVVTSLRVLDGGAGARELLLPNSCQHCKNPVCMIDCPTGAIGRDPQGEVFIREDLCTGCGNCAKACPWENIRMAPRTIAAGKPAHDQFAPSLIAAAERRSLSLESMFPEVATKCDLCRDYEAPACVQSCPTEAIIRLEPERDFAEVASMLNLADAGPSSRRLVIPWGGLVVALAAAAGLSLVIAGVGLAARGLLSPAAGPGLLAGIFAALAMLGLVAHALPKRLIKTWMRPKQRRANARALVDDKPAPITRSKLRPYYLGHLSLGLLLPGLVLTHTGLSLPANAAGTLAILSWMTLGLGMFGGACYALIPSRLTKLERGGALPEDLARERELLLDRLQRELSGKSAVLKQIVAQQLLPWARAPLGSLELVASGRDLGATRAVLRERVEASLPAELRRDGGRPHAREQALAGLEPLLRTCVELRALPARRLLTALLRGWLGPHVVLTGALLLALIVHVLSVTLFAG
ncbi:Formate hydrogenlyase subunit 2 [Enhygromyxa salina]|uniref:Formate hydrogenlyase subunit 2 n=1 Tax=Enhygromyxa salina TaxID=215803 RepID=A0A0C2D140_9BACT|nr:cyclic nucleotide-binding domain-containing protein [Enhygromyxa salina]KIG13862.1 Formate hydrogenlyase subunit 2 [Enhygromyxa salina]